MRVLITGEAGFIARNLHKCLERLGHTPVYITDANVTKLQKTGEVCVYRNSAEEWAWHLKNLRVDVVIHNAAVVGTDVVALNPNHATLSNVVGSYNLAMASKSSNTPVCYMGTTVIYDTAKYQSKQITETSDIRPMTFYGSQKLAGENVITSHAKDWLVMRPLFAYGGVGDMNSLIAKTIYAHKNGDDEIDMFLDPNRVKDYLHVEDFCNAVIYGCTEGLWGRDYNVAAETPHVTSVIMQAISDIAGPDVLDIVKWHPQTDYLGNHMLSSEKFRKDSGWSPELSLQEGIKRVYDSIMSGDSDYNPLYHLNKAKEMGVDLTKFYNSNI